MARAREDQGKGEEECNEKRILPGFEQVKKKESRIVKRT